MKLVIVSLLIAGLSLHPYLSNAQDGREIITDDITPRDGDIIPDDGGIKQVKDLQAPTPVPFDGGISALLLAGAAAYGAKKAARKAKSKELTSNEK